MSTGYLTTEPSPSSSNAANAALSVSEIWSAEYDPTLVQLDPSALRDRVVLSGAAAEGTPDAATREPAKLNMPS